MSTVEYRSMKTHSGFHPTQVRRVRKLRAIGFTAGQIAKMVDLLPGEIRKIIYADATAEKRKKDRKRREELRATKAELLSKVPSEYIGREDECWKLVEMNFGE